MLVKFYGQLIFNSERHSVGIEMLVRGIEESDGGESKVLLPADIFSLPEFESKYFHALDMLAISAVNSFSSRIRLAEEKISYIFVNLSDSSLKDLLAFGKKCLIYQIFRSTSRNIKPLKLVIEINETSLIDVEGAIRVTNLIRSTGALVAQDDYDNSRSCYTACANWDFVKKNSYEVLEDQSAFDNCNGTKIIERAVLNDLDLYPKDFLYQGFELHKPEDFGDLLKKLGKLKAD